MSLLSIHNFKMSSLKLTLLLLCFILPLISFAKIETNLKLKTTPQKQKLFDLFKLKNLHYHSINPIHHFSNKFDQQGVDIQFYDDALRMELKKLGRLSSWQKIQPGKLSLNQSQKRLERKLSNNIIEWYQNLSIGLEHGVNIQHKPKGEGKLQIVFDIQGAKASQIGNEIWLKTKNHKLIYNQLVVIDGKNQHIPASIILNDKNQIVLLINDQQATYPISIDPLLSDGAFKITANDAGSYEYFGSDIDIDGNIAVIGAAEATTPDGYQSGAVYIFERNDQGEWLQTAKLFQDGWVDDYFGSAVSLQGNTLLVGAWGTGRGETNGAVYVYIRDTIGNWIQQTQLIPPESIFDSHYGIEVKIHGDTALIGANFANGNSAGTGAVYVFTRDVIGNWTFQAKLQANDGEFEDLFGMTLDLYDNTAVIGAQGYGLYQNGKAYIFVRDNNNWTQQVMLVNPIGQVRGFEVPSPNRYLFGGSVAIYKNTILISAIGDEESAGLSSGAVFVYHRDQTGLWSQGSKLMAFDAEAVSDFGDSISLINESICLIGSSADGDFSGTQQNIGGSSYLFIKTAQDYWVQGKIRAWDGEYSDGFGGSIVSSGNTALISAEYDDQGFGSAYFYELDSYFTGLPDSDQDGVWDGADAFPTDINETTDSDGDGIGDNTDTDDDNDGMPDNWENQYGFDPKNPNDATLDADNDGFNNLQEYQRNTNPIIAQTSNTPPTATNKTITLEAGSSYSFSLADFSYQDVDNDAWVSLKITELTTVGTLNINGINNITLNQIISVSDINKLIYNAVNNPIGMAIDGFKFTVNDGLDDSLEYIVTINTQNTIDKSCGQDNVVVSNYTYNATESCFANHSLITESIVVLNNTSNVEYVAPLIILKPGFHVIEGATFIAKN